MSLHEAVTNVTIIVYFLDANNILLCVGPQFNQPMQHQSEYILWYKTFVFLNCLLYIEKFKWLNLVGKTFNTQISNFSLTFESFVPLYCM